MKDVEVIKECHNKHVLMNVGSLTMKYVRLYLWEGCVDSHSQVLLFLHSNETDSETIPHSLAQMQNWLCYQIVGESGHLAFSSTDPHC